MHACQLQDHYNKVNSSIETAMSEVNELFNNTNSVSERVLLRSAYGKLLLVKDRVNACNIIPEKFRK